MIPAVFRIRYYTVPGQSLWLKWTPAGGELRETPMNWSSHDEWAATLELDENDGQIEYHYQLRQENGVALDEWLAPRILRPREGFTAMLSLDVWRSAGTVDYSFETNAFQAFLPSRGPFTALPDAPGANHLFQLHMAAVPPGQVPCLLGNVNELGTWDLTRAVPMHEVSANVWQVELYLPQGAWVEYKYGLFESASRQVLSIELWENRNLPPHYLAAQQWTQVSDEGYRRADSALFRAAGVAIPIFSLRSQDSLGVGEFADLKPLADWAASTGLKLIQILPINDTTSSHQWTDSYPYSAISVFALHPLYLRIRDLEYDMPAEFHREVLDDAARLNELPQVDYEQVMHAKWKLTREIYECHRVTILKSAGFQDFLRENRDWLVPYAVFCVKRDQFATADFTNWADWAVFERGKVEALTDPSHPDWPEVAYHLWLQYELDHQLADAVRHLHTRGLALKGDLPIGIDRESVDAWSAPHLFKMNAQAGAPPDAFAVKGQNWGFPTYDWEVMQADGYAWWRSRFKQLSRYFDAYRIDHILGFFRIWQVPFEQVEGIMGYFDPALPIHIHEFDERGIPFDFTRYCMPYLPEESLAERFGEWLPEVLRDYLQPTGPGTYQLRDHVATQRQIEAVFSSRPDAEFLREALMDCVSDVLFFEVPGSDGTLFHPRCSLMMTRSFHDLDADVKWRVEALYNDYFYRRQEDFWQAQGYEKLPAMRRASQMLLCGEDLGMVPACVPGVMKELGMLSLEIQRMPKIAGLDFFNPAHAPYLSVVSPSTHDMATLRGWWREDARLTSRFARQMLGLDFPPAELSSELATRIMDQHLRSPAMWAIFPLQDLLAMDGNCRHPQPDLERINVPAIIPFYWRYRMHLGLEELSEAAEFNTALRQLLTTAGR